MARERELVETFVELADTLVVDYDVIELLYTLVNRCSLTLDATDAGILLPDPTGTLEVVASTSERSHLIGLLQLDAKQGPCLEAYYTGRIASVDDISSVRERWPLFAGLAGDLGYESMHAIPLRLRDETIGSLNLFSDRASPLPPDDAVAAQGLADIATIGILHQRAMRESHVAREQLQHALDSRVVIEQAKGVLAQSEHLEIDEAFEVLRSRARSARRKITDVARDVVDTALGDAVPRAASDT